MLGLRRSNGVTMESETSGWLNCNLAVQSKSGAKSSEKVVLVAESREKWTLFWRLIF